MTVTARSPLGALPSPRRNTAGRVAAALHPEQLPSFVEPLVGATVVAAIGIVVVMVLNGNYYDSILLLASSYAIVVLGMALQVGYSHQLAFSQSFFMGVGAYGVAVLNTKYHWPISAACVAVVVAAAVGGLAIGAFVTRVPGFALALATLFFPVIAASWVTFNTYLGASTGLGGIASLWSGSSFTSTLERSGVIAMLLLGAVFFVCGRIMRSGIGLEVALLGADERVAASVGVNTPKRKLELFVLGSAIAALGGAVFAGTQVFVSTGSFDQTAELTLLIMLFIGGRRSLFGALIGAVGIEYLSGTNNWVGSHLLIIEGVLFTLILLYAPDGFIDLVHRGGAAVWRVATPHLQFHDTGSHDEDDTELGAVTEAAHLDAVARRAEGAGHVEGAHVLECRGLSKSFGGVRAVDDVSFIIEGAGVHAICGPNGAGKTTLFELIAGGHQADAGQVLFAGRDITKLPPYRRAQFGMARTLQSVRLMGHRSVLDNVAVAALKSHREPMLEAVLRSEWSAVHARASAALEQLGIGHMAHLRPGALTLEAQRMVELARALVAHPNLLLLDEPASGLGVEQRARLADTLVELGEQMTVVLVEHDLQMVARVAREIFVLIDGRMEFHGNPDQFLASSVVRTQLMGLMEEEEAL